MPGFPVSDSTYRIRRALRHLQKMTLAEKLGLMVRAGLLSPKQAAKAIERHRLAASDG